MYTTLINAQDLSKIINDSDTIIIDCRFNLNDTDAGRSAYAKAHLPKARYAHLDDDLSGKIIDGTTGRHPLPNIDEFSETLSNWGIDNSKQVVVYDDKGGAIASRLWWMLQWLGHSKVAILNGGVQAWEANGFQLTNQITSPTPSTFVPNPQSNMLVDAILVENAIETNSHTILDARAAERYRGEHEPIDPVAGHIPTAISMPFMENWTDEKLMLQKNVLHQRFEGLVQEKGIHKTIVYCGSGVTACHNILAIQHAGLGMAKLYAGSWSDWITDVDRPLRSKSQERSDESEL